jgi:hypothetical protein
MVLILEQGGDRCNRHDPAIEEMNSMPTTVKGLCDTCMLDSEDAGAKG